MQALAGPLSLSDHLVHPTAPCRAQNFPSTTSLKALMSKAREARCSSGGVLVLDLLQSLHIVAQHRAILLAPAVKGLLGNLEMPAHHRDVCSFSEQAIVLAVLSDDLLVCDVCASP